MPILGKLFSEKYRAAFSKLISLSKSLFTPVALVFIIYFAWQSRDLLIKIFLESHPGFVAASVILWLLVQGASIYHMTFILKCAGSKIPLKQVAYVYASRVPARYLPGGIWHTVSRMNDFYRQGIPMRHLSTFVYLENATSVGVTLVSGGVLLYVGHAHSHWGMIGLLAAVMASIGIILGPRIVNNFILRQENALKISDYLLILLINSLFWTLSCGAFLAYVLSFPVSVVDAPLHQIAAAYLFSWGIGFLAFFAPQGIGIFESVMTQLISSNVSAGSLFILIAGFRLIALMGDFMAFGISRLIKDVNRP